MYIYIYIYMYIYIYIYIHTHILYHTVARGLAAMPRAPRSALSPLINH